MSQAAISHPNRIDQFFSGPGARGDQWRNLVTLAESWSNGSSNRAKFEAALAEMTATEEFHAYPGFELLAALRGHAEEDDAQATASLARRITRAILTRSFRQNVGDWDTSEDDEAAAANVLPPTLGRAESHGPPLVRNGAGFAALLMRSFMSRSLSAVLKTRFVQRY
jgi:arginine decarboxylase